MRTIVLGLAFAFTLSACGAPAVRAACAPPIALDLSGVRPAVTLSVGDREPLPAIFDTGAMTTIINIESAEALGLRNEGPLLPPFDRPNHASQGYQTTLTNATLSGLPLGPTSAPVLPLPLPGYVAIFSPNIFSGRLVTFDFAAAQLLVCDKGPDRTPSGPAYGYSPGPFILPTIPVAVGGQTIDAHLDTGSPMGLIFPTSYAARFQLAEPMKQVGMARTHAGERPIYSAQIIGEVRVGPLTLTDPEVRFTDIVPGVNVGMALLRQMSVTLDPEEKRLWATATSAP